MRTYVNIVVGIIYQRYVINGNLFNNKEINNDD
jgi:hypothetical protein